VEVFSGGLVVRTDGNNFIAEMAAASIVMKAFPLHVPLLLRIDSMATIGAITKGIVSERKRIRAAGRAWLNLCRMDFVQKQSNVTIEHVASHKGTHSAEQIGNDAADRLANKFRLKGEKSPPAPYLLETEELFFFQHNSLVVQGDPRDHLKQLEKDYMMKTWKEKAPKQAKWFTKHPTQIAKQAKGVWKWAVESGRGKAWLYFVFAICQWLPTNHRINYTKDVYLKTCTLCLCNAEDEMDHLLLCPALAKEHLALKNEVTAKLIHWKIPFAATPLKSNEMAVRLQWRAAARKSTALSAVPNITLDTLTKAYWKVNIHKQCISTNSFVKDLTCSVQKRYPIPCVQLRQDLTALLVKAFVLQTHGFTDVLNYSNLFEDWTSINQSDVPFGAKLWTTPTLHSGTNSFFFQPPGTQTNIRELMNVLNEALQPKLPSRFLCVIPQQDKLPPHFLELVTFKTSSPLLSRNGNISPTLATMSLVLAMNKESMLTDPINWIEFKDCLTKWSGDWPPELLSISAQSDALFAERSSSVHSPRALSKHPLTVLLQSSTTINFFDAYRPKKPSRPASLPPRAAALIGQMNRHPPFLGLLGILPNQLRTLLKETGHENREEALLDLSHTLFFAGYRVWEKRQKLAAKYYRNITKVQFNGIIKRKKRKKNYNADDKISESNCRNPFHYLRRHDNLSKQRPTKCPCRNVIQLQKLYINQPITVFAFKYPIKNIPDQPVKTMVSNKKSKPSSQTTLFRTRTENIRREHDRGKKRSYKQLTLNINIAK
jgi:hypothetical protein